MAENREEILANFQGITAIEDVAEAILHLDQANWDLLSAINRVMPQDGRSTSQAADPNDVDVEMIDDDISVITPKTRPPDREDNNQASTSSPRNTSNSIVELQVNFNNKIHDIKMSGAATVSDLRKRLESLCGVPVCRQQLSGLGGSRAGASAPLGGLGLPPRAVLRLKAADGALADDDMAERLTATYILHVTHEDKDYTLKYPGTKTVQEVKNDIFSLTDIPVRHQVWTGWPSIPGLEDTVLAMVGLDEPQHELTVRSAPRPKEYKRIVVESSDSDNSSVEEIEDGADTFTCEDDMFVELVNSERLRPLMSENVQDEALGCIEFAERFRARYGPNTPAFFEGTLQDAIRESCQQPARERKLLGVYLHHEQSVLANVFCAQLLGCDTVLHTLNQNFILYGWDLTSPHNNNMLLSAVSHALGPVASMTVRSIPVERLPALVLIMRVRSTTEIYSVINGNVGVSELVGGLVEAVERFAAQRDEDARLERERDARQRVKLEQDEAYQRSLEADRYLAHCHTSLISKFCVIGAPHPNLYWQYPPAAFCQSALHFIQWPHFPERWLAEGELQGCEDGRWASSRARDWAGALNYVRGAAWWTIRAEPLTLPALLIGVGGRDSATELLESGQHCVSPTLRLVTTPASDPQLSNILLSFLQPKEKLLEDKGALPRGLVGRMLGAVAGRGRELTSLVLPTHA